MWASTLRELLRPQRLIPIVALAVPLAAAQHGFSVNKGVSNAISAVLLGGFVLVGPWSWRWASRQSPPLRWLWPLIALLPFALAFAMSELTEAMPSFLLSTMSGGLAASLFLVGSWGLGRDIDLDLGLREATARAEAMERAASSARLLALDAHLDPHFLFNTLNAIAEWCTVDPERAEQAILDLAGVLRTIQQGVSQPRWPLTEEVALARRVLELHRARDPERFDLDLVIPATTATVPPLLLLPLVENAITHGPATGARGPVRLHVHDADLVEVEIRNPGGYAGPREGGTGLQSVRDRLALTWGDAASLSITEEDGETVALLRWPRA